jgi:hypothetical protein
MASAAPSEVNYGDPAIWALLPGETIERTMLQERYGGRTHGRIGPSTRSPNVLLFSDPAAAEPHGHFDGWRGDGCFHYTGEGQRGDQRFKAGNAAILGHADASRALRLFSGANGRVAYEGEFELARERPFYTADAPETHNGPARSVIVFRLRPLDRPPKPSSSPLDRIAREGVEEVALEERWTELAFVAPEHEPSEADRAGQELLLAYCEHLRKQGHDLARLKIVPAGEAKPLFAELVDRTSNTLLVVKGTVARDAIRTAVGQLLDYRRFVEPAPRLAVLLPSLPREDLRAFLASAGVDFVWREGKKFRDSAASG